MTDAVRRMTPEERIAAALGAVLETYSEHQRQGWDEADYQQALDIADPTIAADLALAAAVRKLPKGTQVNFTDSGWFVYLNWADAAVPFDTLTEAIESALR